MPDSTADLTVRAASLESWTIEPYTPGLTPRAREIWQYRKLLLFFSVKAVQKLYRRTKLGWLWIFIRPLFPLAVKALVFGGLLGVTAGVPYFLFLVTSTTVWELFANAFTWGTRSLEMNRGLLRQLYVPRIILVAGNASPALVTFLIYMAVLAGTFVWFRVAHGHLYLVPGNLPWALLAVAMALTLALALALWTSVPALVARDVRFTVNYVLGFWVFLTPVMYPMSSVPEQWRFWMLLNPMAPVVEMFKFGILGIGHVEPLNVGIAGLIILIVLGAGLAFFFRAQATAADRT